MLFTRSFRKAAPFRLSVPKLNLPQMTELRTERLLLRRWRDSDREPFFLVNSNPRVMQFYPKPFTREESDTVMDRYESSFKEHGFGRFAIERCRDHAFLGMVGILIATHPTRQDRKSTRLNSSHPSISYAVFCLIKKTNCAATSAAKSTSP